MSDRTPIEWAANADGSPGATWNPIVGCSVLSPGCKRCYAMRAAARHEKQTTGAGRVSAYAGLTRPEKSGAVWTGEVRLVEGKLLEPLGWKKPRTVFVNSMGDLFHEAVEEAWLDRCFAVMALTPQHTFIILTKRAKRMRDYVNTVHDEPVRDTARRFARALNALAGGRPTPEIVWPLPNVWLGVSIEDKRHGAQRAFDLAWTQAAKRVWSVEPLLEDLGDLTPFCLFDATIDDAPAVDWVIVGGESGIGARPLHPAWVRNVRDQCGAAGAPFFFKQWGAWRPVHEYAGDVALRRLQTMSLGAGEIIIGADGRDVRALPLADWSIRSEGAVLLRRVGKGEAGRTLDGREWRDRPPLVHEQRSAAA